MIAVVFYNMLDTDISMSSKPGCDKLGAIRDRLLDGVLALASPVLPLPSRATCLWPFSALTLRACLLGWALRVGPVLGWCLPVLRPGRAGAPLFALIWRRREVAQFVGIKPGRLDGIIHRRTAAYAGLAKLLVDGFCLLARERLRVIFGEDGFHLRPLLFC